MSTYKKLSDSIDEIKAKLEEIYIDHSDAWQEGEKGQLLEELIQKLEEVSGELYDF